VKQRLLMCILLTGVLLYYAIPRLDVMAEGVFGVFSIAWLSLALLVVAGNMSALVYAPKKRKMKKGTVTKEKRKRMYQS
jgi:hypothetical protein